MAETRWFPAKDELPGVVGRFAYQDIIDVPASQAADEKVYKQVIVLHEKVAGSHDESVRKVMPHNQHELIKRYPDAWSHFQGQDVKVAGTPLSELVLDDGSRLNEDRLLTFRLQGISTIEQLAVISDATCQAIGFGTRKLRERAQTMLASREQAKMAALMASTPPPAAPPPEMPPMMPSPPKRRGRPPKAIVHHA